jgi:hypothetical protein
MGEGGNNMPLVMQETTGALCARTYKNSSVQEAESDMFVITPAPATMAFSQNEREEVRDLQDVAGALSAEPGTHQQTYVAQTFKKDSHAKSSEDGQGWVPTDINDTLNAFDSGETRTPTLVVEQPVTYQETTGALCASGYNKLGTQEAMNDMYVVQSMETFHCTTEDEKTQPLKARDYKDPQIVTYAVDMGAGKSQCGINQEQAPTLTTTHGGEPVVCYSQDAYDEYSESDSSATLRATGGTYGGGSETLVTVDPET